MSLPLDILPSIVRQLTGERGTLAALCRVSRSFDGIARPALFSWIRLFGKDLAIVRELFTELAGSERAKFVRRLEVRVFPLSLLIREREEMERLAVRVLESANNITELVWSRRGSISDSVLEAIVRLPRLRSLELNAHTTLPTSPSWDGAILLLLPLLRSLSLVLPDHAFAKHLPAILDHQASLGEALVPHQDISQKNAGRGLTELSILCRESPVISRTIVPLIGDALRRMRVESFSLAGCTQIDVDTLLDLISTMEPTLRHLSLESVATPDFWIRCTSLAKLKSLRLTHPASFHRLLSQFDAALARALENIEALDSFTIYHSGSNSDPASPQAVDVWPTINSEAINVLVEGHAATLRKFECSGVLIELEDIERLSDCRELRNLVVHLGVDLEESGVVEALSKSQQLETLHLMSQAPRGVDAALTWSHELATRLPNLRQIGYKSKVWIIERHYSISSIDSAESVDTKLIDYNSPFWPEALLIVKT